MCVIVVCMSRNYVVRSCFCVLLFVCLRVYGMACMWPLFIHFIGLFCVRCSAIFFFSFRCVCFVCGVLCCCLLCRCFAVRVCCAVAVLCSVLCVWYGLNDFPVCD